ncbi:hypothetical protein BGZ93_003682, partial [Podila epicladia]
LRENSLDDRDALSSVGFYFNASKNDLGSDDLSLLARDVFSELFSALDIKLKAHVLKESDLLPLVREVFESIQQKLLAFNYPIFSTNTKLRLVVGEAQILSDRGSCPLS